MTDLQVFTRGSWSVRSLEKDGEPWFVAIDVCRALEISNGRDTVSRLDDDEKDTVVLTDGIRGNPNLTIISEAGLFSLVLSSRKPEAKEFKRWVTHEVLPSIRKTGSYGGPFIPKTYSEALRALADKVEETEQLRPRAEVADKIASADNCMTIQDFAKSLGEGPKKIYPKLADLGVLYRNSENDWVPKQSLMDQGYFRTHITTIPHGERVVNHTTALLTARGKIWLTRKLLPHSERSEWKGVTLNGS